MAARVEANPHMSMSISESVLKHKIFLLHIRLGVSQNVGLHDCNLLAY